MPSSLSTVTPRLMRANQAAGYLGMSPRKFHAISPVLRKRHEGMVLYDRHDLDAFADAIPYEMPVEESRHDNSAIAQAFGDR